MSVSELILFCSTASRASIPCMRYALDLREQRGFPIRVVRLDTREARARAANGKYFQIRTVPALLATYMDGNIQLFVGQPKIMQWLNTLVNSQQSSTSPEEDHEILEFERSSQKTTLKPRKKKVRFQNPQTESTRGKPVRTTQRINNIPDFNDIEDESDDDEDRTVLIEGFENDSDEDSDDHLEEVGDSQYNVDLTRKPTPLTYTPEQVGPENVMDMAKRMERQRESSIGSS